MAVGYNRRKFPADGEFSWHAEASGLKKAGRRAMGASLYVIRVRKDGSYGNAEPCPNCKAFIERSGIVKVDWSKEEWNA